MENVGQVHRSTTSEASQPGKGSGNRVINAFKNIQADASMLLRQEIALAKTEAKEKSQKLIRNIVYLLIGATIALVGTIELIRGASNGIYWAFIEAGMITEVASWLAPVALGGGIFILGLLTFGKGVKTLMDADLTLEQTKDSLKEDKQWIKQKIS